MANPLAALDVEAAGEAEPSVAAQEAAREGDERSSRLRAPLVWIDLEMSGLDPAKNTILEIAVIITDGQLLRSVDGPQLVISAPEEILAGMDEWNQTQHATSGLLDRVRCSRVTLAQAQREVLAFVSRHCHRGKAQPAGACVFKDIQFLEAHMPQLADYLHHRTVDVSSVRELAKRWFPREFRECPRTGASHRALDDIRYSIDELRYYRRTIFKRHANAAKPLVPMNDTVTELTSVASCGDAVADDDEPSAVGSVI